MNNVCPKCGSQRFLFDGRFQSYICQSCKYSDHTLLMPTELGDYAKFLKFIKHALKEGDIELPSSTSSDENWKNMIGELIAKIDENKFTYEMFEQYLARFMVNVDKQNKTPVKKTSKKTSKKTTKKTRTKKKS